jgi:Flp pilus assembly protein CpaB
VSPRVRAALFGAGALVCGLLSALLASAGSSPAGAGLEALRPVVVSDAALAKGTVLGRDEVAEALEERRVPEAFAPPDALRIPAEALGRRVAVSLPAGSYLTAAGLAVGPRPQREQGPPRGTTPVEITVTGAGALEASRVGPGAAVDVVVSGEPGPGPAAGRTYIAAERVPLIALRKAPAATGLGADRWVATLALSRSQALRLIRAEGVARSIRLLAR